jgi:hypothetical protein
VLQKSNNLPGQKLSTSEDKVYSTELAISDRNVLKSLQNIADARAQQVEYSTLIPQCYSGKYRERATCIGIAAAVPNLF